MEIISTQHNDVTILAISGSLDAMTADKAVEAIKQDLDNQNFKLVIDLDGIDFLSSAGMRTLLATLQTVRQKGGDLRLAGGSNNIRRTLEFSGFTKIMKSYDSSNEAVESFAS